MSIFLSLAFTEILHLVTIFYILKRNNVLFEQLHLLEPSMWQYLFLINYKEFQAPQNCSSPQPYGLLQVCVHCCECALGWVKCRGQIPSMGHHTWPHTTSLSLSPFPIYRGNMLYFEVKNRFFYHLK